MEKIETKNIETSSQGLLTIHKGVGRYEVWKGLEEGRQAPSKDSYTKTEKELWDF